MLNEREALPYRDLVAALQGLCNERATGVMLIHTDSNHSARIGLADGTIQSLTFGRCHGTEAIEPIKGIRWGKFTFSAVAYRALAQYPLPATETILAELSGQTQVRSDPPPRDLSGVPRATPTPEASAPMRANPRAILPAARVGQSRPSDPFAPQPQAGSVTPGVTSAKGLAGRLLRRGSSAPEPAPQPPAGDLFSRTSPHAAAQDPASGCPENRDSALAVEVFGITPPPDLAGPGGDAEVMNLAAAAPRAQAPLHATGDERLLAELFAVRGRADAVAHATTERQDHPAASDADRIVRELFGQHAQDRVTEVLTPDDLDLGRRLFGAAQEDEGLAPVGPISEATSDGSMAVERSSEDNPPLASALAVQRIIGPRLVAFVIERLSQALGPLAPIAVAQFETQLRALSGPGQLDAILSRLAAEIEDPAQGRAFCTEVAQAVFDRHGPAKRSP